jgi:hypothetical protein
MAIGDPPSNLSLLGIAQVPDMWAHINADEMRAQLMRDMANAQVNNNAIAQAQQAVVHSFPPPPPPPSALGASNATLGNRAREIFLKRMGGLRSEMVVSKDDFLQCHVYNEQVYVFYCFDGRHGVTLEGIDMFPSDTLITQFRLVLT